MLLRFTQRFRHPLRRFDEVQEAKFLAEYHDAARKWAGYATAAASGLYLGMLLIVGLTEPHQSIVLWVRLLIVAVMSGLAATLFVYPDFARKRYVWIAAMGSATGLLGIIALFVLANTAEHEQVVTATPSFIFGLLLHYSFLRLPPRVAAGVGWSLSVIALPLVPMAAGGSASLRTGLFLVFANICGMVLCRLGEARERELFAQRGELESARSEARLKQLAAEDADKQKTRLIAALSHDLRQPMTAAVAYIDVLNSRLREGDPPAAE